MNGSQLTCQEPYRELGVNYFDERVRQDVERRLVRRLQRLGYEGVLWPTVQAALPPAFSAEPSIDYPREGAALDS